MPDLNESLVAQRRIHTASKCFSDGLNFRETPLPTTGEDFCQPPSGGCWLEAAPIPPGSGRKAKFQRARPAGGRNRRRFIDMERQCSKSLRVPPVHQCHLSPFCPQNCHQLYFGNGIFQQRHNDGVRLEDIRHAIKQAAQKHCFVCGKSGATITCCEMGCDRSFHLPCAEEGECVTQFFGLYRSFCWEHSPEQAAEVAPEKNTTCLICLDLVEDRKSYRTMVCPACKHAWFHRDCIQKQAIHAGCYGFCCLHCQNQYHFSMEMLTMGIQIPRRLASSVTSKISGANTPNQVASGSSCSSPALEGSSRSSPPGPIRVRDQSRSQRRAQSHPYSWARQH
ncbi:PREDICTED: G2/M phase-specific E3 ubiquitin-protein ligase-like [Chaetura pelagica]|uniref:G2/M phase-specific E3 ubiquitin-protein ligase-like n=1 Tax=Chaetura pelagica TaxID=8897 RepID=UPI0005234A56|nr:PREDICTED: G2/M phase-specific E3 ubiquitin-protein ligase-like [Chaetura pelagica]